MSKMNVALRQAEKMAGLICRYRHLERAAVRHSYIFTGETDQPPGNIQRIFPSFQHPHHPVQSSVRVTVSHGFVKSRDQIIMLLAVFIIQEGFPADTLFQSFPVHFYTLCTDLSVEHRHLKCIQGGAGVSVCKCGNGPDAFVGDLYILSPESFLAL